MRIPARATVVAVFAALTLCAPAHAQAPQGSAKLTPAAVAESLVVLKQLDSVVRTNPGDAATWYRRGMLAWALYERDRNKPPIAGLDWTLLGRMADTSLRIAAQIEQENGQYRLMAGRYLLMSGVSITRLASYGFFEAALEAARKSDDPHVHAETAVEAGRVYWRRYDGFANRWLDLGGVCPYVRSETIQLQKPWSDSAYRAMLAAGARYAIPLCQRNMVTSNTDFPGEADYVKAEALFREAFEAQPSFERAYRQLAMLLVDRNRWRELEMTARMRIDAAPWDAWAWLTLGLSVHRQRGNTRTVVAAFDSAYRLLPPDEVKRLDRLERLVKPTDSTRMKALDPATHSATEKWYWLAADPLWAREGNEPRIEFIARLTYAELRWTVEEMKVRGADTDRGDVHIRYGPADLVVVATAGDGSVATSTLITDWAYYNGLVFKFVGNLTFATARVPPRDELSIGELQASLPVAWGNLREIAVDTMPVQAARFRASADSVDIYVATLPPVARIRKSTDVAGGVRSDFWVLSSTLATIAHDTSRIDVPGIRTYETRVGAGAYVYRAEASADGAQYAARATAAFLAGPDSATGFSTRGFGMSDVLLAASASSRGTSLRWNDLNIQPLVGTVVQKGQVALVWESYDLANERGSARYTVSVTVERQRSALGRIATQLIGKVGSAMGINRTADRVTMHYERNVPFAPAVLDNIALSLGSTPAGEYRLTIAIVDRISGRTTSRSMNLTVAER